MSSIPFFALLGAFIVFSTIAPSVEAAASQICTDCHDAFDNLRNLLNSPSTLSEKFCIKNSPCTDADKEHLLKKIIVSKYELCILGDFCPGDIQKSFSEVLKRFAGFIAGQSHIMNCCTCKERQKGYLQEAAEGTVKSSALKNCNGDAHCLAVFGRGMDKWYIAMEDPNFCQDYYFCKGNESC